MAFHALDEGTQLGELHMKRVGAGYKYPSGIVNVTVGCADLHKSDGALD